MLSAALMVFAVGLVVSALATSLLPMLIGRVIQGGSGGLVPLSFSILGDELPRDRVHGGVGRLAGAAAVGGGAGVVLGGPVIDRFGITGLFVLPLVLTVPSLIGVRRCVPPSPIRSPGRIDWFGAGAMAVWLSALLAAITRGPTWGWASTKVLVAMAVAAVMLIVWVSIERRVANPLVDLRTMRHPLSTIHIAALMIGFGMYGNLFLVPRFLQSDPAAGWGFGATVTETGLFLLPMTLATLVIGYCTGRLTRRLGSRSVCALGCAVGGVAFGTMLLVASAAWQILAVLVVVGISNGLCFASLANLVLDTVPPAIAGVTTATNVNIRSIGAAAGTSVCATVLVEVAMRAGDPTRRTFQTGFLLVALSQVAGCAALLFIPRRRMHDPSQFVAASLREQPTAAG